MDVMLITEDSTRDELVEAITLLNADAKALSRQGKRGTLSQRYAALHAYINVIVTELERTNVPA